MLAPLRWRVGGRRGVLRWVTLSMLMQVQCPPDIILTSVVRDDRQDAGVHGVACGPATWCASAHHAVHRLAVRLADDFLAVARPLRYRCAGGNHRPRCQHICHGPG